MLMRNPEMMLCDSYDREQKVEDTTERENLLGHIVVALVLVIAIMLKAFS